MERPEENVGPLLAFKHFVRRTGMHAVPTIASVKHRGSRAIWTTLLLLAVSILTCQIVSLSRKVMSYPTSTKTAILYDSPMTFPAVTICNLNPIKRQQLMQTPKTHKVDVPSPIVVGTGPMDNMSLLSPPIDMLPAPPAPPEDADSLSFLQDLIEEDDPPERVRRAAKKKQTIFEMRQKAFYHINRLNADRVDKLTYRLDDLLYECTFRGKECDMNNFLRFTDPRYGACYMFNTGLDMFRSPVPILSINNSGSINGLEMTLNVDQDTYLPRISPIAGLKVLIHDQLQAPLPDQDGYFVGPGRFTALGIRKSIFQCSKHPYGKCKEFTDAEKVSMNMFYDELPQTNPTLKVCMKTCEQLEIIRNCKCYSLDHGKANSKAFENTNMTARKMPCSLDPENEEQQCVQNVVRIVSSGGLSCKKSMCYSHECRTQRFGVSQTTAAWPANNDMKSIRRQLATLLPRKNFSDQFVQKNFLKLLVYFEDLTVVGITTQPSYGYIDFLSDLGGQGGLWLGISAFTVLEFGVLIFELIKLLCCRCCKSDKKKGDIKTAEAKESETKTLKSDDGSTRYPC